MMIDQTPWRSYMLALTSIGINFAVICTLFFPTVGNRSVADYKFSERLKLPANQVFIHEPNHQELATTESKEEIIKASQHYKNLQDGRELDLHLSYFVRTRGDVATYLQNYTTIDAKVIKAKSIKQVDGIGYHALFTDNNRAYLSSCISPRSLSNVTQRQFSQHRYQNDLKWQVGLDWLQGKASIRDRRCLWVLLSTPITQGNSQTDYQALERVWQDIYQMWSTNFPSLIGS